MRGQGRREGGVHGAPLHGSRPHLQQLLEPRPTADLGDDSRVLALAVRVHLDPACAGCWSPTRASAKACHRSCRSRSTHARQCYHGHAHATSSTAPPLPMRLLGVLLLPLLRWKATLGPTPEPQQAGCTRKLNAPLVSWYAEVLVGQEAACARTGSSRAPHRRSCRQLSPPCMHRRCADMHSRPGQQRRW
jgi:hypothetical protein